MAIKLMVPNALRMSEFQQGLNGTCTQTAASVLVASSLGTPTTHDGLVALMLGMYHDQRGRAAPYDCAANGASTVVSMAYEVKQRGVSIALEVDYHTEPMAYDWVTLLRNNAGIRPILLQIAKASNLREVRPDGSVIQVNAGVNYHAICVVGVADEGYVIADGNNPRVESEFAIYPMWALQAALPCGLIMASAPVPAPAPQGSNAVSQFIVKGGFALYLQNNPSVKNLIGEPIMNEAQYPDLTLYGAPPGTAVLQIFERGTLVYHPQTNVVPAWGGNMLAKVVSTLQAQIADLQRQQQPTTQLAPAQQEDLNFMAQLRKAVNR